LQVSQLVAYLETLTDPTFLTSPLFSDPFVTLPGDYSGDGFVDQADYELWRSNFGDTTSLIADGNADGIVDAGDYTMWRNNVGRTWLGLASGAGSTLGAAVPEPGMMVTIAVAAILGIIRRRRR
jgi:hypothetical protein